MEENTVIVNNAMALQGILSKKNIRKHCLLLNLRKCKSSPKVKKRGGKMFCNLNIEANFDGLFFPPTVDFLLTSFKSSKTETNFIENFPIEITSLCNFASGNTLSFRR